jgi:uncharacterized Zn finger protein (UPF0148 family)
MQRDEDPDPLPRWTNEHCPFCGNLIQWDGDQLFCAPCQRTWCDWEDVRFDRYEVKYAARKAAEDAAMWAAYYESENDQRDEDGSGYADAVAEGLERWTR